MERKTLDGPKLLDLSYSSALLMLYSTNQQALSYTETTPAYLTAGTSADTTTTQSTPFSRAFTLSSNQLHTPYPSSLATLPARTTPLTHRPEESTAPPHLLLPPMDIPEYARDFLTDSTNPLSARKLRELQEGRYSTIATRTLDKVHAQQQEAKRS